MNPTHWMDDRGMVVTDEFLKSDKATSDYRDAYVYPAVATRFGVRPMYQCKTCRGTGELGAGDDECHDCGGCGAQRQPSK